jgi:hypothetical protein
MKHILVVIAVGLIGSQALGDESLKCTLTAVQPVSAERLINSAIMIQSSKDSGSDLRVLEEIKFGEQKSILVDVTFDKRSRAYGAALRAYGSLNAPKFSNIWHFFGVGSSSTAGILPEKGDKTISLTAPLTGEIESGYLEDREDKGLVTFSGLSLSCHLK